MQNVSCLYKANNLTVTAYSSIHLLTTDDPIQGELKTRGNPPRVVYLAILKENRIVINRKNCMLVRSKVSDLPNQSLGAYHLIFAQGRGRLGRLVQQELFQSLKGAQLFLNFSLYTYSFDAYA